MLDGLVRGAVLSNADGIVRQYPDKALLHERGQADGVSGIIGEHKERAAVGDKPAMQRKAVHDGTHDEFTHTVGQVVAVPVVAADAGSLFVPRAHGTGQVGGTAEQFRQMRSDGVQDVAVGDTGGDLRLVRVKTGDGGGGNAFPVGRQCAAHPALEFGSEIGIGFRIGGKQSFPLAFKRCAALAGVPRILDVLRHDERFVLPAERGTHGGVFIRPHRRAVA